ncbi:MAG TPA: antibiotic biosynthesis monooxygenase [Nocardioidaceae bacterium]|nr:antibiotic biosynthesis monooxygenase [Nocardioidaceae bacterium]
MAGTPTVGLLVTIEARPGRERDVEHFLDSGLSLVNEEPETALWFAIHLGGPRYGIFDVFLDDAGRDAHLHGKVAEALMAQSEDLFTGPPDIQRIDIRAAKLP